MDDHTLHVSGGWLYFCVDLRYRDVEALRAERDARTSLP
jgi:hypothetical protein